jgi:hypothetical protein
MNARSLKLKANSAEFESKLTDIRRLKRGLEEYLNRNFYFERCEPFTLSRPPEQPDRNLVLTAVVNNRGVSFGLLSGAFQITEDAQFDLGIVRIVHDNMDVMIELAEELCKKINRLDNFKAFLKRFDVE